MKTQLVHRVIFASIASLTLVSAGAVRANVIGVDFYNSSTSNQTPGTSAVVGPYASAGWYNEVDASNGGSGTFTLTDSTAAATTATFNFTQGGNTLSGNSIYNSSYGVTGTANATYSANQQLYNGAAAAIAGRFSQEVVLKNIPYSSYSVYLLVYAPRVASDTVHIVGSVENFDGDTAAGAGTTYYFQDSNQSNGQVPADSELYAPATSTSLNSPTTGANYVEFSGLTNPNEAFDFVNDTIPNQPYSNNIALSAIEIVDTSGSSGGAVPEPASIGMLSVSGVMLLLRRRGMRD
jgi:hypothetical protein